MQILSDTDVIVAICPKSVLDSGDRKHPASAGEQAKQRSTCSFAEVFQDVRCHFTRSLTNLMKMGEVEATTFCQRLASSCGNLHHPWRISEGHSKACGTSTNNCRHIASLAVPCVKPARVSPGFARSPLFILPAKDINNACLSRKNVNRELYLDRRKPACPA